jgi:hypothetical protein
VNWTDMASFTTFQAMISVNAQAAMDVTKIDLR